jgi:hypothetical protein
MQERCALSRDISGPVLLSMSALTVGSLCSNAGPVLVLPPILRLAPLDHFFARELSDLPAGPQSARRSGGESLRGRCHARRLKHKIQLLIAPLSACKTFHKDPDFLGSEPRRCPIEPMTIMEGTIAPVSKPKRSASGTCLPTKLVRAPGSAFAFPFRKAIVQSHSRRILRFLFARHRYIQSHVRTS